MDNEKTISFNFPSLISEESRRQPNSLPSTSSTRIQSDEQQPLPSVKVSSRNSVQSACRAASLPVQSLFAVDRLHHLAGSSSPGSTKTISTLSFEEGLRYNLLKNDSRSNEGSGRLRFIKLFQEDRGCYASTVSCSGPLQLLEFLFL